MGSEIRCSEIRMGYHSLFIMSPSRWLKKNKLQLKTRATLRTIRQIPKNHQKNDSKSKVLFDRMLGNNFCFLYSELLQVTARIMICCHFRRIRCN